MSTQATDGISASVQTTRRENWLTDGLVSGFIATFAMSAVLIAAFGISRSIGSMDGGGLSRWFWALANNLVTERTSDQVVLAIAANLAIGLILAVIYAYLVEPRLSGPGWRRGMQFALIPWLLSILIFLPLVGGGFLGLSLGAGILPIVGNLILHLVYGAVLGGIYDLTLEHGLEASEVERRNAAKAERGAAIGVIAGLVVGLLGGWLLSPQLAGDLGQGAVLLAGALIGAAGGLAAGSLVGMGTVENPG